MKVEDYKPKKGDKRVGAWRGVTLNVQGVEAVEGFTDLNRACAHVKSCEEREEKIEKGVENKDISKPLTPSTPLPPLATSQPGHFLPHFTNIQAIIAAMRVLDYDGKPGWHIAIDVHNRLKMVNPVVEFHDIFLSMEQLRKQNSLDHQPRNGELGLYRLPGTIFGEDTVRCIEYLKKGGIA